MTLRRRDRGRHRAATALTPDDRDLLAEMAADAIDIRLAVVANPCPDCDRHRALLCDRHAAEVRRADAYRELARALGARI